ncbi:MAG: glycosyltransferase family A protein [Henriciella sp.]|uniref:glycosyltransferase family 2 protein n=1 Tax=Henriciella sp. TaxID=1968823 RepID=UPI003C718B94
MSRPILSIIIPAYNRANKVGDAIATLAGAPPGIELIVVDDGSADGTAAAARTAIANISLTKTQVIEQENAGPSAARNRGIAASTGRYIAFLDSDDRWMPGAATVLVDLVVQSKIGPLTFLATHDIGPGANGNWPSISDVVPDILTFPCFTDAVLSGAQMRFAACNLVMTRDLLSRLGGFSNEMFCAEDTDLFMRANAEFCTLVRSPILVLHEIGAGDQLTGDAKRVREGLGHLVQRAAAGLYPGRSIETVLAGSVAHAALVSFAAGQPGAAYGVWLRHLHRLLRAGAWHWALRLPLLPLLHLIRPSSFAFRWRPKTGRRSSGP